MTTLRWGICSAGRICEDFVSALSTLSTENHRVQAVAARNIDSARKFAETFNVPNHYSDYESLFTDPEVDIIYVGTINSGHEDAVIGALRAGKHVLCEKVLGVNAKETARMIKTAEETGRFLMEGYWTRLFPAWIKVREDIKAGVIGEPKVFSSNFGYVLTGNVLSLEYGGGATTGLGCYLPMMAQYAFFTNSEAEKPLKVVADGILNEQGVDKTVTVTIHYSNERVATFVYTIALELLHDAYIAGTKGIIKIPDYSWTPTTVISPTGTFTFPLPETDRKFNFPHSVGLSYEAEHVRQCLLNGLRESPLMPLKESLILAEINDEIRRQLDVRFPQDDI